MGIARMSKVSIALHASHKDEILKKLQDEAALHISTIEKREELEEYEHNEDKRLRELETELSYLDDTIAFLQNFIKKGGFLSGLVPEKVPISPEEYQNTASSFNHKEITGTVKKIEHDISKLKSEHEHIASKRDVIEPWCTLTTPVELIKPTETTIIYAGTKGKTFSEYYQNLLIMHEYILNEITRIKATQESIKTRTTYVIEGWVESDKKQTIQKIIDAYEAAMMVDIEPGKDEKQPVKLVNRLIFQPFEIVTKLYGTPSYHELDPSPLLAIFFAVFFGICITDAGYGIILALLALLLMKKMPSGKKFLWLIFIGAIFTIIEGALLGGWFGNLFEGTFLDGMTKSLMVFDPMKSYFVFYRLALAMGCIQIFCGLFIKLYEEIRNRNFADAFFEAVVWISLISSLLVLLFASDFCIQLNLTPYQLLPQTLIVPFGIITVICCIIIVIFGARNEKNPFFRLFLGVLRLTILGGIFSYLGDFLSYIRLMALGLVTAGIASAINEIARMTLGIPVVGIVIFIIILVGGHLFNLGINTLGGFVHTLRLQYVEFFQKFFVGGGISFNPLGRNEKYIFLKEMK
jgi:V/A-type H+-transporting ATPase subunit I